MRATRSCENIRIARAAVCFSVATLFWGSLMCITAVPCKSAPNWLASLMSNTSSFPALYSLVIEVRSPAWVDPVIISTRSVFGSMSRSLASAESISDECTTCGPIPAYVTTVSTIFRSLGDSPSLGHSGALHTALVWQLYRFWIAEQIWYPLNAKVEDRICMY